MDGSAALPSAAPDVTHDIVPPCRVVARPRWWCLGTLVLSLGGCGDASSQPELPADGTGGGGGATVVSCPPGETPLEDGSCEAAGARAGTPPEQCAEGFVADDAGGCAAQIVEQPCDPGQLAQLGEQGCHDIAPCGAGTWGEIDEEPTNEYVDPTFAGISDGSQGSPWATVADALVAAAPGAIVALAAGTYEEDIRFEGKAVRLQGRCPSMVSIDGAGVQPAAISVVATDGVELRGVSVTGPRMGIWVLDSSGMTLDEVRIHDTEGIGVAVRGPNSRLDARTVLIEGARVTGLLAEGATVHVDSSTVRAMRSGTDGVAGYGMMVQEDRVTGEPGHLTVRSCVVERCRGTGLMCLGANLDVEGVLVRDTLPDLDGDGGGVGIGVDHDPSGVARASLQITSSEILRSIGYGVVVHGGEATIEATSIRNVAVHPLDTDRGWGIALLEHQLLGLSVTADIARSLIDGAHGSGLYAMGGQLTVEESIVRGTDLTESDHGRGVELNTSPTGLPGSQATIRSTVITDNHEVGLMATGIDLTVESTAIRQTLPNVTEGAGYGLVFEYDTVADVRADAQVRWCAIESNIGAGLVVAGSNALIESTLVSDTRLRPSGTAGVGIAIQLSREVAVESMATVQNCRVQGSHETGIMIDGSDVTIEATDIAGTEPDANGTYGDCVGVRGFTGFQKATKIHNSTARGCGRSGIAAFGAVVELSGVTVDCNPIHLNGEPRNELDFSVADLGGNWCGCGEQSDQCRVLSAGLEAPEAVY